MKKLLYILIPLLTLSCNRDPDTRGINGRETLVKFSTSLSQSGQTRAESVDEGLINDINIYVFHDGVFAYRVSAYNIVKTANGYDFDARIKATSSSIKMYLLANTLSYPSLYSPSPGETESTVREKLTINYNGNAVGGTIPLFGECVIASGINEGESKEVSGIKLIRTFAAVSASLKSEVQSDFELESIQVYRTHDKAAMVPDNFNNANISVPTVPTGVSSLNSSVISASGKTALDGLYIPESEWYSSESDRQLKAACIIIGGKYKKGKTTYYRVDFPNEENANLGRVLRNHKYHISVAEVAAEGWDTPGEAADNLPASISTEIIVWHDEDAEAIFIVDGSYLAISTRTMILPYYVGANKSFIIETDLSDYKLKWVDENDDPIDGIEKGFGETLTNQFFNVEVAPDGSTISVTTLQDNSTGGNYSSKILITSAKIHFTVSIYQQSRNMRQYLTIFNFSHSNGDIGDDLFGTSGAPTATGLRGILKNTDNFGLDGVVKFPGFYLGGLNYSTSPPNAPLLSMFNVVYLPTSSISVAHSKEVLSWLVREEGFLVLYFGAGTNANMVSELGINRALIQNITYRLSSNAYREVSEGPFGTIPSGYSFYKATWEAYYINANQHPEIKPVLVGTNETQIILGVDPDKRIVYVGDINLFGASNSSGAVAGFLTPNGIITNDHDRLIGNLWAYIAETLLKDR